MSSAVHTISGRSARRRCPLNAIRISSQRAHQVCGSFEIRRLEPFGEAAIDASLTWINGHFPGRMIVINLGRTAENS
jgi:hypothetical protein